MAKKIVLLPLDERPCNFDYPHMMPKTECNLILPPKEIMGKKKQAGDTDKIAAWVLENAKAADVMILSLDTLVYGGIVPSRLHHESAETLMKRLAVIKKLKEINPEMKLYGFGLIMRCPTYSSADEEPCYYADCGAEIHLYGKYTHLTALGGMTAADETDFARVKGTVPADALDDYLTRRKTNLAVLMHALSYAKDGTFDYFIVPQDDAAVYGFTAMDQMTVRAFLKEHTLHLKTAMYPSADDIGLTLLARATNEIYGTRPRIYVHYASIKGADTVPMFEDRRVGETIKYHILSVGGIQVYSLAEADILLAVNIGSEMMEISAPNRTTAYDIERNLAEFVNYVSYALEAGKIVSVADVAYPNTADPELTALLSRENLLLKLHAYAGWNTSSNTIGTVLCQAILYQTGRDDAGNTLFLLHRYYEDIGYMAHTRRLVYKTLLPPLGMSWSEVDGPDGQAAALVKAELVRYMQESYPALAALVNRVTVRLPWSRMFEADVKLNGPA